MPSFEAAVHKETVKNDMIASLMRGARQNNTARANQKATQLQQLFQRPQTVMQRLAVALARPLLLLASAFQQINKLPIPLPAALQGAIQQTGNQLASTVGKLLSLFFGFKKENDKVEEHEQRDDLDGEDSDMFTKVIVNETNASMDMSGQN